MTGAHIQASRLASGPGTWSRSTEPGRHPHQAERPPQKLSGTATAPGYADTFPGRTDQASQVRRDIAPYLDNYPAADD